MAWNDQPRLQLANQLEDGTLFYKTGLAFDFGKNRAEAVLPECICGNQGAIFGIPKND